MKFLALVFTLLLSIPCIPKALPEILITPSNSVMMNDQIAPHTFRELIIEASYIRNFLPLDETMYIVIYSPGGRVDVMYAIMEILPKFPNTKLICVECASAAGAIFAASTLPRLIVKNSVIMMHEMKFQYVSLSILKRINVEEFELENDKLNKLLYTRIGISKEEYELRILDKDWYVQGQEILDLHLADEMVEVVCSENMWEMYPMNCSALEKH